MLAGGDGAPPVTGAADTVTTSVDSPPTSSTIPFGVTTSSSPPEPIQFLTLTDDSGTISVDAPAEWTDHGTGPWTREGGEIGPAISAAVSIAEWVEGWETPGMFVGVTDQVGFAAAFGDFTADCMVDRTETIAAAGFPGSSQWWWGCGPTATSFFVGVVDLGGGTIALFQILERPEALPGVVERALGSFSHRN